MCWFQLEAVYQNHEIFIIFKAKKFKTEHHYYWTLDYKITIAISGCRKIEISKGKKMENNTKMEDKKQVFCSVAWFCIGKRRFVYMFNLWEKIRKKNRLIYENNLFSSYCKDNKFFILSIVHFNCRKWQPKENHISEGMYQPKYQPSTSKSEDHVPIYIFNVAPCSTTR